MHKNVKILIAILSILVALGYIIWLKNKLFPVKPSIIEPTPTIFIEPTVMITPIILNPSTPSAQTTGPAVYNGSSSAKINNYGN